MLLIKKIKISSRFLLLFCSFCISMQALGQQNEANIWYFGRYLGLDFNSGTAVPLNDGLINTTEGVATICDANGDLLFYTDGSIVRNRLHQVMPNGSGLWGNYSSTQSAVIVPWPGDVNRYFVFTVDAQGGPRGFSYSVVNMTLNTGNGDVEIKNISLQNNVTEKVTAVKHCNNRDVWVITHGTVSNTYYSFLITSAGINTTPVISNTGTVLPGVVPTASYDSSTLGYLKASPDGSRLAAAHFSEGVEVSNFDNATGVVSNTMQLFTVAEDYYLQYGVEFSPSGQLLYTTAFYTEPVGANKRNVLYQFDVSLPTETAIRASRQTISLNSDPIQTYAALQIAPDGKLYMSKNTYKHISAINNPDVYGTGCGFVSNAVQFSGFMQVASFGFPSFVQSYFYPVDSFEYTIICPGLTANFIYQKPTNVFSVLWDFGDPASGSANSSVLENPAHQFSASGDYLVKLIKYTNCGTDTLQKLLHVEAVQINLGADTTICGSGTLHLNASAIGSTNGFLWQDGSTNPDLIVNQSGLYWVESQNSLGCIFRDSIQVNFSSSPVFSLGADTSICTGTNLQLTAYQDPNASYTWSNGAMGSAISVNAVGMYWAETDLNGCIYRDTVEVLQILPTPIVDLGIDQNLCEGEVLNLDVTQAGASYLWQDGSTHAAYSIQDAGNYFVTIDMNGCKNSDTISVSFEQKPDFTLGPDQTICVGSPPILLMAHVESHWQLEWQDGSSLSSYSVTQPGVYALTATSRCGSFTDAVEITQGICKLYIPDAFTPNNDGLNDVFRAKGVETVTDFVLHIYNRYGQIVFSTRDKFVGWNGYLKGKASPMGGYVFTLSYKLQNDDTQYVQKGQLLLIR